MSFIRVVISCGVEDLSEALLDFSSVADLQAWLEARF
nr:DUF4351 domain-containing protein [Komarekiella delphini-convector]